MTPIIDMQSITQKDNLLVKNAKNGDLIELEIDHIGKVFVYTFLGSERLRFFRRTGKCYQNDYHVVAWGSNDIEAYRSKQVYKSNDDDLDKTRFSIPSEKNISTEDGGLAEVAELVATRVKFHIYNNDWDGAIRIVQNSMEEHFKRLEDLLRAAKTNGLAAPINLLGLSLRITNALERSGCVTIFDLCVADGGALMLASGIGPDSYDIVRKRLDEFNFDHRMEPLKEYRKSS